MTFPRKGQKPDTDKYNEESAKLSVPKQAYVGDKPGKRIGKRVSHEPATEDEIREMGRMLYPEGSPQLDKFVAETMLGHKIAAKLIESAEKVESLRDVGEAVHFDRMANKLLDDTDRGAVKKALIRLATLAADNKKNGA